VLLYKSAHVRGEDNINAAKDQADFDEVRPHMNAEQHAWLRWAIETRYTNHPWIDQL
jgi:hypothetical protein